MPAGESPQVEGGLSGLLPTLGSQPILARRGFTDFFFFFKCHPAFKIPSESIGPKHPVYHSQTWKLWLTVYPRH